MNNNKFLFFQGSTPTLEFVLPLVLDSEDIAVVTFRQGDVNRLEYAINEDVSILVAGTGTLTLQEGDGSVLLLAMSQADTLRLSEGDVEIQLRIVTDAGADSFAPVVGAVGPAFRKEVMTL